jgi:hypothetical protein
VFFTLVGGAIGSKRGTSQFVARTGFVRLRGKSGRTDSVITGCTGGVIVDLLNPSIGVVGQGVGVKNMGVGVELSRRPQQL